MGKMIGGIVGKERRGEVDKEKEGEIAEEIEEDDVDALARNQEVVEDGKTGADDEKENDGAGEGGQ